MRGRPRKPTAIKELEGTDRPDRANPNEPKLAAELPDPPDNLDAATREQYFIHGARVLALRVMTQADVGALVDLARCWVEIEQATAEIEADGGPIQREPIVADGEVVGHRLKKHPGVLMRSDASKRYMAGCAKFGLTPADRSRVSALPEPKQENKFAKLSNVVEIA